MIRPPFLARVAAGIAVTAYEETLKLPSTAVALPMTTVSQILQTTMRMQQVMTSLAIKGDQFFEILGAAPEETAEWATFDDDLPGDRSPSAEQAPPVTTEVDASAPGRFALYSVPPGSAAETVAGDAAAASDGQGEPASASPTKTTSKKQPAKQATAQKKTAQKKTAKPAPSTATEPAGSVGPGEIVEYLDYDSLTLAQLRARLRTLSVDELGALLEYENSHAARPPFVTMLSNRITTARSK